MTTIKTGRRLLLKGTLGAAAATWIPQRAFAQPAIRIRVEWQQFKLTGQYGSFRAAIAAMRANTNPLSRGSLQYWANVHVNQCPHGAPYFVAWHRGYLYYFEQQLRIASGDPTLNLPYWDYYSYATMPAEFTDPGPGNPLYLQRPGANVRSALDLAPFAPTVFNFQHGAANAFEPKIEDIHNPVHDLIGGVMSTMQSPLDPIFYLHHASIDRLTHAWALPDGKGIPYSSNPYSAADSAPYWAGNHVYAADLTMPRYLTLDPSWLGVDYANTSMPTTLPPLASLTVQREGAAASPALARPPLRSFTTLPARRISASRRALAGVGQPTFDEQSTSIMLRLNRKDAAEVARVVSLRRAAGESGVQRSRGAIKVRFDRTQIAGTAGQGGFFYALYLNMPAQVDSPLERERSFIGTVGAFQIAAASHHGAAVLEFDVSNLLARQQRADFSELTLSWVRVNGDQSPAGTTIEVEELRLDLAFEAQPAPTPPLPKPPGFYRRRPA